jgi:diguanylate cyclase (GGDEF)-like protein
MYVHPDATLIGENVTEIEDIDGSSIHEAFYNIIQKQGEGYHTYNYSIRDTDEISEKTSYIKGIDRWQVYIGMGFHTDELKNEISTYSKSVKDKNYFRTGITVIFLLVIGIFVYVFIKRGGKLQNQFLKQEDIIYEQFFELSAEGVIVVSVDNYIAYENNMSKKIIGANREKYIIEGQFVLPEIKPGIFKVKNDSNRSYYIGLKSEKLTYHGKDSIIYFINDITKQYLENNELEKLALYDELTKLPNRRKLIDDFEDLSFRDGELSNNILGMIDLDLFKVINDIHGHTVGDSVLKLLGEVFVKRLRSNDTIYRYGGEEFVMLLLNIEIQEAKNVLESILIDFSQEAKAQLDLDITFSCGLTSLQSVGDKYSLIDNINIADQLLYKAKENGRNRIEI